MKPVAHILAVMTLVLAVGGVRTSAQTGGKLPSWVTYGGPAKDVSITLQIEGGWGGYSEYVLVGTAGVRSM